MIDNSSTGAINLLKNRIEQEARELETLNNDHRRKQQDCDRRKQDYDRKQKEAEDLNRRYVESKAEVDKVQADITRLEQQRQRNVSELESLQRNIQMAIKNAKK